MLSGELAFLGVLGFFLDIGEEGEEDTGEAIGEAPRIVTIHMVTPFRAFMSLIFWIRAALAGMF